MEILRYSVRAGRAPIRGKSPPRWLTMLAWIAAPSPRRACRRPGGRRRGMSEGRIALGRQPADQPVGLDRIMDPGCRPAMGDAGPYDAGRDSAAVAVPQRQLPARFRQAALQISLLRLRRPQRCNNIIDFIHLSSFKKGMMVHHAPITCGMSPWSVVDILFRLGYIPSKIVLSARLPDDHYGEARPQTDFCL
jgi:hypothetical protein